MPSALNLKRLKILLIHIVFFYVYAYNKLFLKNPGVEL